MLILLISASFALKLSADAPTVLQQGAKVASLIILSMKPKLFPLVLHASDSSKGALFVLAKLSAYPVKTATIMIRPFASHVHKYMVAFIAKTKLNASTASRDIFWITQHASFVANKFQAAMLVMKGQCVVLVRGIMSLLGEIAYRLKEK